MRHEFGQHAMITLVSYAQFHINQFDFDMFPMQIYGQTIDTWPGPSNEVCAHMAEVSTSWPLHLNLIDFLRSVQYVA